MYDIKMGERCLTINKLGLRKQRIDFVITAHIEIAG